MLVIRMESTFRPCGTSHEMVSHQGCLEDSVNCKLQKASSFLLLDHPSLSRKQKRDVSKDDCPSGRETTKRNLPTAVTRTIWYFLAYVFYVVLPMSNTLPRDTIYRKPQNVVFLPISTNVSPYLLSHLICQLVAIPIS